MTLPELLARLREMDIRISQADGVLQVNAPKGALTPDLRAELAKRKTEILAFLERAGRSTSGGQAVRPPPRGEHPPLSPAQRQLWSLLQLQPESTAYNMHLAFRLEGALDADALLLAHRSVCERHEALRTRIARLPEGILYQSVDPPGAGRLVLDDRSGESIEDLEGYIRETAAAEAARPFDVDGGPLVRAALLRLDRALHLYLVSMHHLVSDARSFEIYLSELGAFYGAAVEGRSAGLEDPTLQFPDYAAWQLAWLETPEGQAQREFWQAQLAGDIPATELPARHLRPVGDPAEGGYHAIDIPSELAADLRSTVAGRGATLFQALAAAFSIWLHRYSGQAEILVCTPVAGRTRAGTGSACGYFNNTLALRTEISGDPTYSAVLDQVRASTRAALAHQDMPFSEVAAFDNLRRTPLTRAMLVLQPAGGFSLELPGIRSEVVEVRSGMVQYELSLTCTDHGGRIAAEFGYRKALFSGADAGQLAETFLDTLRSLTARPERQIAALEPLRLETGGGRRAQPPPFVVPRTALEKKLAGIWEAVFNREPIGVHDSFFDLGGHSLLALRLFEEIRARLGRNLPLAALLEGSTIAQMAQILAGDDPADVWSLLVPIQPAGEKPPFFCVHGITGDILWFRRLGKLMAADGRPFLGLQARGLDGVRRPHEEIPAMAAEYLDLIRAEQPHGPYFLGGASLGGTVALEIARQLREMGEEVALLVMFDHAPRLDPAGLPVRDRLVRWMRWVRNIPDWLHESGSVGWGTLMARARRRLSAGLRRIGSRLGLSAARAPASADLLDYGGELPAHRQAVIEAHWRAIYAYQPEPYDGDVLLLQARAQPLLSLEPPDLGWGRLATGALEIEVVPGSHEGMFKDPHVQELARALRRHLDPLE